MKKLHPLPVLALILGVLAAVGITSLHPAPIARTTQVTPPSESRVACQPLGSGELIASGHGDVTVAAHGAEAGAPVKAATGPVKDLRIVRGVAPHGGVLGPDGSWAPCQAPATSGMVVWPSAAKADLRITNSDARDASVDLVLTGPEGEISALGSRGIDLAPGETRSVAISVLAQGIDAPVAARWSTSRGRVTAVGVTAGTVQFAAPSTQEDTGQLLVGQAKGATPTIVVANPGTTRANLTIRFHSPSSTFVPEGGQDVSVPAHTVTAVALGPGTAGEAGAFTVASDQPVAATLFAGTGDLRATMPPTIADTSLSGLIPTGSTLQLTNPGEQRVTARLVIDGTTLDVVVEPGVTSSVPVEGDGVARVQVKADQPLAGAAVLKNATAAIALGADVAAASKPLEAELAPGLR